LRIIGRGAVVVKALHPLGLLSSRIELSPESQVCVEHVVESGDSPTCATDCGASPAQHFIVSDVAAAARHALRAPLGFPPFAQATVPGDRLAIAVDEAVPLAASVVRGVVGAATEAGIEPESISVVTSDAELAETLPGESSGPTGEAIQVVQHSPADANALCLVGRTHGGQWLRINRTLFDADIVLPIGCARLPSVNGSESVFGSLFPRFSDAETIGRLRAPSYRESTEGQATARRQADEAGWLLGVPMVMQVVPGGDGSVAEVAAGEPSAVAAHCQRSCRRRWSFRVAKRASLVIAAIGGGRIEQRWENVARALAVAEGLTQDGGAVAICSNLETPPNRWLARLIRGGDWEKAEYQAAHDNSADGWTAWQLARALARGPVYLLSQLEAETVEEMGLAPVADMDELARLAGRHESCIVLDDSQHAVATVAGDS
jgi:Lactate racemase N-terminal domain